MKTMKRKVFYRRLTAIIGNLSNIVDKSRGKGGRKCRVQGSKPGRGGLIRKYGINMNRQVFRERAIKMGWKKVR